MGLKCVQCHVNPTGGGMRSVFGNTFAQTQLAAKTIGSDEDLWTGQVMKFLSVGGNARANYSYSDVPNQSSTNDFAVEEARAYLDFGVIPNRLSVYIDQRFAPGNSTNLEANIRYWINENSIYVKAGRMYLPFGYRFEDDNAFVRQLSGINMQAPDEGVEFGFETGSWSTQVALSNGTGGGAGSGRRQADRGAHRIRAVRAGAWARARLFNDTDVGDRMGAGLFGALRAGPGHLARRGRLLRRRQHRRRGPQAHGLARRGRLESRCRVTTSSSRSSGSSPTTTSTRTSRRAPACCTSGRLSSSSSCAAVFACTTAFRRTIYQNRNAGVRAVAWLLLATVADRSATS